MAKKPFKRIFVLISKLPLAGKLPIKPLFSLAYTSRGTAKLRLVILSSSLLGLFILGHFYQALLAWRLFDKIDYLCLKTFLILYGIVNVCAVYVQVFLITRITIHC
ncbi:MAG: hypothetical protein Q8N68_02345, partial [bacterium]|nr:hypothetical protein [bacterium]